jgi:hypothetical protein
MTKGTLYFIALCFFVVSCNAQEAFQKTLDLDIKEDLKIYLLTRYDDIKISEIYSKNSNKNGYLQKSLGNSLLKEVLDVKTHDIYFKELSAKSETHFGIVYLRYATPDKAKKSLSHVEKKGFFENTKILTQYVAVNIDEVNLIVYTESSADKTALNYLDTIANKFLNNVDKK